MKKKLTKRRVKKIWKLTCKHFGYKPVYARGVTQKMLGWFRKTPVKVAKQCLIEMGVQNVDNWLSKRFMYVQIGSKKYIVMPEKLASKRFVLWHWLKYLAHESEHGVNCDEEGWIKFYAAYFKRKGARAGMEGRADAGGGDVCHKLRKTIPSADRMFDEEWRRAYKMRKIDAQVASETYEGLLKRHKTGHWATTAGGVVCGYIEQVCG